MAIRKILYLGLALSVLHASGGLLASNEVAQAKNAARLEALSEKLKKRGASDRHAASAWARDKGIPLRRELPNGKVLELQRLEPGAPPTFYITNNVDAADTVSTDEVWPGGSAGLALDGGGMTVGEWDGGAVLVDHPDLYGRVTQADGATTLSNHATHVAGTLVGAGVALLPEARGMAYAARLDAFDWNFDTAEMAAAAAGGLLLSNHSYGIAAGWIPMGGTPPDGWWWIGGGGNSEDPNFGYYDTQAQVWDQIAFEAPHYLIVKAAGNDRWDTGPEPGEEYTIVDQDGSALSTSTASRPPDCAPAGYDCLPTASVAKNILTVGAVNDLIGGYLPLAGPAQVQMTGFSGWGPTDDGRIKPDVVANGWLLMSTYAEDPYYAAALGTSMAAPNVTGSLLLLQEHYQDVHGTGNFMRAATLKALAIHTADEAGAADGPDYENGWGLLNTRAAAQLITDDGQADQQIIEGSLSNGATDIVSINVSQEEAVIRATLVWNDPPGTPVSPTLDPADSMLVNDLDLRITHAGATYPPWVLNPASPSAAASTGDNVRDNVEQVVIAAAGPGSYSVEVSHKNALLDSSNQDYALIISVNPPAPQGSSLLLDEDFSGGLPAGWSVETLSGASWAVYAPVSGGTRLDNLTGGTGKFAMVNIASDETVTSLRTPLLDLSSAQAVVLRFKSNFEYDFLETINVDVSTDGGASWNTAWQHQGFNPLPTQYTLDLTGQAAGRANVMLRFRFDSEGWVSINYWQVDDVQLEVFGSATTQPGDEPPGQAGNPNPADGSSGIGVDTLLSWSTGAGATSHRVYLGTDSDLSDPANLVSIQTEANFSPASLDYDTAYYWRIDEANADGTTGGVTWSFTTEAEPLPALDPGVIDSGQYGKGYGTDENETAFLITFEATGTDLVFSVTGYDIDWPDEIAVYLNGDLLGNLGVGPDQQLNAGTSFSIPASRQLPGTNQITFTQKVAGWTWGVTDLLLTEGELAPEQGDIALDLNVLERGEYGHRFGSDANERQLLATFDKTDSDLFLSVTGYDIDWPDEIYVYVNGTQLGNLSTGPNEERNAGDTFVIPAAVQRPGRNQILFFQKTAGWIWGVTDLILSDRAPSEEGDLQLLPNVPRSGKYGHNYGTDENETTFSATFEATGTDLLLSVTGYDIDWPDEIAVYFNGVHIDTLSVGADNGLNAGDTLALPAAAQRPGSNEVLFVQKVPGWTWGVTDLLLSEGITVPEAGDAALTLGVLETGRYGHRWGSNANKRQFLATFEATGTDLQLDVTGYDIDWPDEILVYLNGTHLGNLSKGPNNKLNAGDTLVIPASGQRPGSNEILFFQKTPGWIWGVTQLLLTDPG